MRIGLVTAFTVAAFCITLGTLSGVRYANVAVAVMLLALAQLILLFSKG
jgi:hypothetical protein